MPTSRMLFNVSADTGTWGDTGPAVWGGLLQMHWNPTTADTGADLTITLLPKEDDTGDGWIIYNDNDCLGANFTKVPYQATHEAGGAVASTDTGTWSAVPVVFAGDRPRVKVTPGGAAVAGRLYLWFFDGH